ncbi:hypothetical protein EUX98_g8452 [Antrodiella citrinella]|uniref:Uncharacterized protein n=1 Tax=Antrodiella citrinella TaxID=2447956 RepID=A0A4S4M942_9APHY|nr:hypothetical protein EUX98_g8452 [Antrodiella citrinella]
MRTAVGGFLASPGLSVVDVLAKLQPYPTLSTLLIVLRHMEAAHHVAHGALREPNYTINSINELLNRFRTMMIELELVQNVIINTMVIADVNPEYLSSENLPPPPSPSPPPRVPTPRPPIPLSSPSPVIGTPPAWWGTVPSTFIPRAWEVDTVDLPVAPPHASEVTAGPVLLQWEQENQLSPDSPVFIEDQTPAPSPMSTPVVLHQTSLVPGRQNIAVFCEGRTRGPLLQTRTLLEYRQTEGPLIFCKGISLLKEEGRVNLRKRHEREGRVRTPRLSLPLFAPPEISTP